MRKKIKKAFTLVELLVVIATVSIVGYNSFTKKAKVSNDTVLVKQMNDVLIANSQTDDANPTMSKALEDVFDGGYDLTKLTPTTTDYNIMWDRAKDQMVLADENLNIVYPEASKVSENHEDLFVVVKTVDELSKRTNAGYSVYLHDDFTGTEITNLKAGIDTGKVTTITSISYVGQDDEQKVVINTNGGEVEVNAPKDTVWLYGEAKNVVINAIAGDSYHEFGKVKGSIEIESGHVAVENTASVSTIVAKPTDSTTVKVTVTKEENIGTIVTKDLTKTTLNVPESVKPTENITNEKLTEMEKFDGGLGTEKSPYLISTADQLVQIENNKAYALIDNIDLSSKPLIFEHATYSHISKFKYGILNGNGHSITMAKGASFVNHAENSKFINLNFVFNYEDKKDQTIIEYASNLTMINVNTYGKASMTGNVGLFCLYLGQGELGETYANFTNCTNYADVMATGYNSLFVGYVFVGNKSTLNFDNCKNSGNYVSSDGAFYLANCAGNGSTDQTSVTMNINNSGNAETGIFRVTNTSRSFNPYIYSFAGGAKVLVKENGETKVDATNLSNVPSSLPFNCFVGPNDTNLKLTLNDDNTFTINKSSYENVTKYVVRVGLYSKIVKNNTGTQIVYVTETIESNGSDSFKTTLKNLSFTETKGKDKGTIGDGAVVVEVDGIDYYYFNVENCGLTNGKQKASLFEVLAYDANGSLVSSYKASF